MGSYRRSEEQVYLRMNMRFARVLYTNKMIALTGAIFLCFLPLFFRYYWPALYPRPEPEPEVGGQQAIFEDPTDWPDTVNDVRCSSPTQNVAFVKTHKTGSSTVAKILQRFGIIRGLSFALPDKEKGTFGYNYISRAGEDFSPDKLIPRADGSTHGYNILYNHAIYNRDGFRAVMAEGTAYVTILRDPFSQFVSTVEYYRLAEVWQIYGSDNPIRTYLRNPAKYDPSSPYFSYSKNKMSEDLGLGLEEYFTPEKLSEYIASLDKDFILVMIMEYFDESLLLLKRKLCWDLKDILYVPKNQNKGKHNYTFTDDDRAKHRQLSGLDYTLYEHFESKLQAQLRHQGEDFYQELTHFKQLLMKVEEYCNNGWRFVAPKSRWHEEFVMRETDCQMILRDDMEEHDRIVDQARRRIAKNSKNRRNDNKYGAVRNSVL